MREPLVIEGRLRNWGDGCEWSGLSVGDVDLEDAITEMWKRLPATEQQPLYTTGPWGDSVGMDNWLTMSIEERDQLRAAIDWGDKDIENSEVHQKYLGYMWMLLADYGRVRLTIEWLEEPDETTAGA